MEGVTASGSKDRGSNRDRGAAAEGTPASTAGAFSGLGAPSTALKLGPTHRAGRLLPLLSLGTTFLSRKHLPTGRSADIPCGAQGSSDPGQPAPKGCSHPHPAHPTKTSAAEPSAALA